MGKIYARLIHKTLVEGITTSYSCLADVPVKYQTATKAAYLELFGIVLE